MEAELREELAAPEEPAAEERMGDLPRAHADDRPRRAAGEHRVDLRRPAHRLAVACRGLGAGVSAARRGAWELSRARRARGRGGVRSAPPYTAAIAPNIAACVPTLVPTTLRASFAAGLPHAPSTIPPTAPTAAPCAPQLNDAPTIDGKTPKRGPWSLATIVYSGR